MLRFKSALLVAALLVGPAIAQAATTTGVITTVTYNGAGLVTGFKLDGTDFTIETPSDTWNENVTRWKDGSIRIALTDQDNDKIVEAADTVKEV